MERIQKALQPSQYLLVSALPEQYEMNLWSFIDEVIAKPEEGSPRAIILCTNDAQARAIHAEFVQLAKPKDLTVDLVVEKGKKLQQRNDLFDGTEIIVGASEAAIWGIFIFMLIVFDLIKPLAAPNKSNFTMYKFDQNYYRITVICECGGSRDEEGQRDPSHA